MMIRAGGDQYHSRSGVLTACARQTILMIGLGFLVASLGCSSAAQKPGRKGLVSRSGRYAARATSQRNPNVYNDFVHVITIHDEAGCTLYKDPNSEFIATLAINAAWDAEDRLWLYCSDDGSVWVFEVIGSQWRKERWGQSGRKEMSRDIYPPPALYPND